MSSLRPQRRGRSISMTEAERDEFLDRERTCRVATCGNAGPHIAPLWFWWDHSALWLYSIVRSQRWTDLMQDGRIAVVVDAGEDYAELRGVEIKGVVEVVGEVPRIGEPCARLEAAETGFHRKYRDPSRPIVHDGKHAWLRIEPTKLTSWDFRKLPS